MSPSFRLVTLAAVAPMLLCSAATAHAAAWAARELGTLGGSSTAAYGINASGQVVGHSLKSGDKVARAFITGADGVGMKEIGTLGGASSFAYGVNADGRVVGYSHTRDYEAAHAFVTGPGGEGLADLGTLGGATSRAFAINDMGRIVGDSFTAAGGQRPFVADAAGSGMTALATPGGSGNGTALALSVTGRVVGNDDGGNAYLSGSGARGGMSLSAPGGAELYAWSVNNTGRVVGYMRRVTPSVSFRAFITSPSGLGVTELGTLGGRDSYAWGVNGTGQVVGHSLTADGAEHAFVTGPGGSGLRDLNAEVTLPAGVHLKRATAINDRGQVVANDSAGRAWLLTPASCTITYQLESFDDEGFIAKVTITNIGSTALTGWTVNWTYSAPASVRLAWNTSITVEGDAWTARPRVASPPPLRAGGSYTFIFSAAKDAELPVPSGLNGTLGGEPCSGNAP